MGSKRKADDTVQYSGLETLLDNAQSMCKYVRDQMWDSYCSSGKSSVLYCKVQGFLKKWKTTHSCKRGDKTTPTEKHRQHNRSIALSWFKNNNTDTNQLLQDLLNLRKEIVVTLPKVLYIEGDDTEHAKVVHTFCCLGEELLTTMISLDIVGKDSEESTNLNMVTNTYDQYILPANQHLDMALRCQLDGLETTDHINKAITLLKNISATLPDILVWARQVMMYEAQTLQGAKQLPIDVIFSVTPNIVDYEKILTRVPENFWTDPYSQSNLDHIFWQYVNATDWFDRYKILSRIQVSDSIRDTVYRDKVTAESQAKYDGIVKNLISECQKCPNSRKYKHLLSEALTLINNTIPTKYIVDNDLENKLRHIADSFIGQSDVQKQQQQPSDLESQYQKAVDSINHDDTLPMPPPDAIGKALWNHVMDKADTLAAEGAESKAVNLLKDFNYKNEAGILKTDNDIELGISFPKTLHAKKVKPRLRESKVGSEKTKITDSQKALEEEFNAVLTTIDTLSPYCTLPELKDIKTTFLKKIQNFKQMLPQIGEKKLPVVTTANQSITKMTAALNQRMKSAKRNIEQVRVTCNQNIEKALTGHNSTHLQEFYNGPEKWRCMILSQIDPSYHEILDKWFTRMLRQLAKMPVKDVVRQAWSNELIETAKTLPNLTLLETFLDHKEVDASSALKSWIIDRETPTSSKNSAGYKAFIDHYDRLVLEWTDKDKLNESDLAQTWLSTAKRQSDQLEKLERELTNAQDMWAIDDIVNNIKAIEQNLSIGKTKLTASRNTPAVNATIDFINDTLERARDVENIQNKIAKNIRDKRELVYEEFVNKLAQILDQALQDGRINDPRLDVPWANDDMLLRSKYDGKIHEILHQFRGKLQIWEAPLKQIQDFIRDNPISSPKNSKDSPSYTDINTVQSWLHFATQNLTEFNKLLIFADITSLAFAEASKLTDLIKLLLDVLTFSVNNWGINEVKLYDSIEYPQNCCKLDQQLAKWVDTANKVFQDEEIKRHDETCKTQDLKRVQTIDQAVDNWYKNFVDSTYHVNSHNEALFLHEKCLHDMKNVNDTVKTELKNFYDQKLAETTNKKIRSKTTHLLDLITQVVKDKKREEEVAHQKATDEKNAAIKKQITETLAEFSITKPSVTDKTSLDRWLQSEDFLHLKPQDQLNLLLNVNNLINVDTLTQQREVWIDESHRMMTALQTAITSQNLDVVKSLLEDVDNQSMLTGRKNCPILSEASSVIPKWLKSATDCTQWLKAIDDYSINYQPHSEYRWMAKATLKNTESTLKREQTKAKKHVDHCPSQIAVTSSDSQYFYECLHFACGAINRTLSDKQTCMHQLCNNLETSINTISRYISVVDMTTNHFKTKWAGDDLLKRESEILINYQQLREQKAFKYTPRCVEEALFDVLYDCYGKEQSGYTVMLPPLTYTDLSDDAIYKESIDKKVVTKSTVVWACVYIPSKELRYLPVATYNELEWFDNYPQINPPIGYDTTTWTGDSYVKDTFSKIQHEQGLDFDRTSSITDKFIRDVLYCSTIWVENEQSVTYKCPHATNRLGEVKDLYQWIRRGLTVFRDALTNYKSCDDKKNKITAAACEWFTKLDVALTNCDNPDGNLGPDFNTKHFLNLNDCGLFETTRCLKTDTPWTLLYSVIKKTGIDVSQVLNARKTPTIDNNIHLSGRSLNAAALWYMCSHIATCQQLWQKLPKSDDNIHNHVKQAYPPAWQNICKQQPLLTQYDAACALLACGITDFYFYQSDTIESDLWCRTFSIHNDIILSDNNTLQGDLLRILDGAIDGINDQSRDEMWLSALPINDFVYVSTGFKAPIVMWINDKLAGYAFSKSDYFTDVTTSITIDVDAIKRKTIPLVKQTRKNNDAWDDYDYNSYKSWVFSLKNQDPPSSNEEENDDISLSWDYHDIKPPSSISLSDDEDLLPSEPSRFERHDKASTTAEDTSTNNDDPIFDDYKVFYPENGDDSLDAILDLIAKLLIE